MSQLGWILKSYADVEKLCLFVMPRSDSNLKLQNHIKIQNLTSKSKISPQNPKSQQTKVMFSFFMCFRFKDIVLVVQGCP